MDWRGGLVSSTKSKNASIKSNHFTTVLSFQQKDDESHICDFKFSIGHVKRSKKETGETVFNIVVIYFT